MKLSELYTDESKWAKGYYAYNSKNYKVWPTNQAAVSWCLIGATEKCSASYKLRCLLKATIEQLFPERVQDTGNSVSSFNDHVNTTFEDVLKVIKEVERVPTT